MSDGPVLVWFRRDFRLSDHPAVSAAVASGRPVVPVFVCDPETEALGAAHKWRLSRALAQFDLALQQRGSQLVLRRGGALDTLLALASETGAQSVVWSRLYDPASVARDTSVKAGLKAQGLTAQSFAGHLLHEPWTIATGQGAAYKVFTPYWRTVRGLEVGAALPPPTRLEEPEQWPASCSRAALGLPKAMQRGAAVLDAWALPAGEAAALEHLSRFGQERLQAYPDRRDFLAEAATSGLSEYLALGEVSPRQAWNAAARMAESGRTGAEAFQRQLVWREFAYHLMWHFPALDHKPWRPDWEGFPWETDAQAPAFRQWCQGRTGVPLVDAAMREMYVTGRMHNRARMVAASYLTKHLMMHWKLGLSWFADCLTDWDPANNAMGWQWVAGCGPDAAPFFRVFNPETQRQKFDSDGVYVSRWLAEGQARPQERALAYFEAVPRRWGLSPDDPQLAPAFDLATGRKRALNAYSAWKT